MEQEIVISTSPTRVVEQKQLNSLPIIFNFDDKSKILTKELPEFSEKQITTNNVQTLIKRMKKTMIENNGIGLSANQCGYSVRMFIMGTQDNQIVCFNPRIIEKYGDKIKKREGCLSYPGMYLYIPRYEKIKVEYLDELGQTKNGIFEGITAQVFQHELDHMNGIVYTEHIGPLAYKMARDKQVKLLKKIKKLHS